MAGSMCPCSSCFASTPQTMSGSPGVYHNPHQHQTQRYQAEHAREKKSYGSGGLLGRLRRSRSIESTASDLVGLRAAAQPVAGSEGK